MSDCPCPRAFECELSFLTTVSPPSLPCLSLRFPTFISFPTPPALLPTPPLVPPSSPASPPSSPPALTGLSSLTCFGAEPCRHSSLRCKVREEGLIESSCTRHTLLCSWCSYCVCTSTPFISAGASRFVRACFFSPAYQPASHYDIRSSHQCMWHNLPLYRSACCLIDNVYAYPYLSSMHVLSFLVCVFASPQPTSPPRSTASAPPSAARSASDSSGRPPTPPCAPASRPITRWSRAGSRPCQHLFPDSSLPPLSPVTYSHPCSPSCRHHE